MTKKSINFDVDGKIKGKARPKFGKGFAYTPRETVNYENWIRLCYNEVAQGQEMFEGALRVIITCWFDIPKSYTKKKIAENPYPTKNPDADNVAKIICDALNNIAYKDDSQITYLAVMKKWSKCGQEFVNVHIEEDV